MVVVIAGLYADPIHKGHIEYLERAKKLGDKLVVIVNNDKQAELKKGKSFMKQDGRIIIIKSLKVVDEVILSIDIDLSINKTTQIIYNKYKGEQIIFANGGDVENETCREKQTCDDLGIKMVDGLGKKIQSSSRLLERRYYEMANKESKAGTPAGYKAGLSGQKIRSKGQGKGLGKGKGKGPIGRLKK